MFHLHATSKVFVSNTSAESSLTKHMSAAVHEMFGLEEWISRQTFNYSDKASHYL